MSLGEDDEDVDEERMMHVLRNGVDEVERTMPRRRGGGGGRILQVWYPRCRLDEDMGINEGGGIVSCLLSRKRAVLDGASRVLA